MADETKDPLREALKDLAWAWEAEAALISDAVKWYDGARRDYLRSCAFALRAALSAHAPAPEPQGLLPLDEIADKAEAYAKELGSVDALRFALENLAALVRQHASRALRGPRKGSHEPDDHVL